LKRYLSEAFLRYLTKFFFPPPFPCMVSLQLRYSLVKPRSSRAVFALNKTFCPMPRKFFSFSSHWTGSFAILFLQYVRLKQHVYATKYYCQVNSCAEIVCYRGIAELSPSVHDFLWNMEPFFFFVPPTSIFPNKSIEGTKSFP